MRSSLLATAIAASLGLAGLVSTDAAMAATKPAQVSLSAEQLQQMQEQIAALQAQVQQLQSQATQLQSQSDAQAEVNVAQAKAVEEAAAASTKVDKLAKLVNDNKIGGRMFMDMTNINQTSNGDKTDASGTGFDVKRFYLSVNHSFNDIWSAALTTDFQYSSAVGATELFVKNAYVQAKLDPAFTLRLGVAGMPWTGYVENYYGYRYVENTLTDRTKFANTADWGVHALGDLGEQFNYAVSVVNGAGYKNPGRSKGMDVEGRVGYTPIDNLSIALGGYTGHLGQETQNISAEHTFNRGDVMVAYADQNFRLGGEYFVAKNRNNVLTAFDDKSTGWSVWGSVKLTDGGINAFARYDKTDLGQAAAQGQLHRHG